MGHSRTGFDWLASTIAVATVLAGVHPAAAQQSDRPRVDRVLTGVVVDGVTRSPIAGAVVIIEGHRPGTMTDSLGLFELSGFPKGPQVLIVRQFGYMDLTATMVPPELPDVLVEIPLAPSPITVEGLSAVVDRVATVERRLRGRRAAVAMTTQAFDRERLIRSAAWDFLEFLQLEARLYPVPCLPGMISRVCVISRGRITEARVYIDEVRTIGGLDELAGYQPHELHLVEVYGRGTSIRAYTHHFFQRMVERPIALMPIGGA